MSKFKKGNVVVLTDVNTFRHVWSYIYDKRILKKGVIKTPHSNDLRGTSEEGCTVVVQWKNTIYYYHPDDLKLFKPNVLTGQLTKELKL